MLKDKDFDIMFFGVFEEHSGSIEVLWRLLTLRKLSKSEDFLNLQHRPLQRGAFMGADHEVLSL